MTPNATPSSAARRPYGAYLLLAVATFLWAANPVAGRAIAHDISPIAIAFLRWALALPILYVMVRSELGRHAALIRKRWAWFALMGLLSTAPNHALVYWSLHYTTAINVQLFNSIIPVLVILVQWAFLSTRPTRAESIGVSVSFLGVLVIVTAGEFARLARLDLNFGDMLVLATFVGWSVYSVLLRFRPPQLSPFAFILVAAAFGVAILAPVFLLDLLILHHALPGADPRVWGWIAIIVIGSGVLAPALHSAGIDRIGPTRGSLFLHLIPVFGVGMAIAVLGESFHRYHALGFTLVLAGLVIANRRRHS